MPTMLLTDEQQQLQRATRAFLEDVAGEQVVRRQLDEQSPPDRASWARMARELGLPGLAVPERFGGAGAGVREVGVVCEEMGRTLCLLPYLSTVGLTVSLLLRSGDAAA